MKKMNNKGYAITLIVFGILIVFIIVLSVLLITTNNSVKLNKTIKESVVEDIQLSADASGMSLTERIEQIEKKLARIDTNSNVVDTIYPVGSIYISTTDATVGDVEKRFGGEWEVYAQGRTLVGVGGTTDANGNALVYNENQTGGSSITALSTSNLPSHSHSYTPSGIVASTFKGTRGASESTGSGYNIGYTYSTRTSTTGNSMIYRVVNASGTAFANNHFTGWSGSNGYTEGYDQNYPGQAHTHNYNDYYANSISGVAAHTHYYTPSGTVSSTFTGTASNTSSVGSGKSFSVQNPYITVYMYKRIN